jgi:hypothetical protein
MILVARHNYPLTFSLAHITHSAHHINGFLQHRSILLFEILWKGPGPRSNENDGRLRSSRESDRYSGGLDRCDHRDLASSLFPSSQQSVKRRSWSYRRSNGIDNEQYVAVSFSHCFFTLEITDGRSSAANNPVKIGAFDNTSPIDPRTLTMRTGCRDGRHLQYSVCSPSCRSMQATLSATAMNSPRSEITEPTSSLSHCSFNIHHHLNCNYDYDQPGLAVDINDSKRKPREEVNSIVSVAA